MTGIRESVRASGPARGVVVGTGAKTPSMKDTKGVHAVTTREDGTLARVAMPRADAASGAVLLRVKAAGVKTREVGSVHGRREGRTVAHRVVDMRMGRKPHAAVPTTTT